VEEIMANGGASVDPNTRDEYVAAILDLQIRSMDSHVPVPQRLALLNRAQEMRTQMMEIEAARFNDSSSKYQAALKTLNGAIAQLRKSIKKINDAIKILDDAAKVFAAADKLLTVAVEHFPIVP
jgi:uncharacterized protein YukE